MKRQKLLPVSVIALGLACAFPAAAQQGQQGSQQGSQQQSAAGGQSAASRDDNTNWGWLGLLGLIGLAGLRRRDHSDGNRTFGGSRSAT